MSSVNSPKTNKTGVTGRGQTFNWSEKDSNFQKTYTNPMRISVNETDSAHVDIGHSVKTNK